MLETGQPDDIKILLADDHEIVRSGIRLLLATDKKMKIIDEATNGFEAVELVKYHKPDVALVDILMPKMNGIKATEIIKEEVPGTMVIMLTAFEDSRHIEEALAAGANGYLSKVIGAKELVKSIRVVLSGKRILSESVINALQKKYISHADEFDKSIIITKREQEILDHVANGRTSPEIADRLFISVRTVESHRYNLMQKLGVNNTAALIRFALVQRVS